MICPLCSSKKFESVCGLADCFECGEICWNSDCSFMIGRLKNPDLFSLDDGANWHTWEETKRLAKLRSFK